MSRFVGNQMTPIERTQIETHPILLFDGVCALCNHLVRFLLQRDERAKIRFIPLESPLAQEVLAHFNLHMSPDGVVLIAHAFTPKERIYHRSDGIAQVLQFLDNPWRLLGRSLSLIPRLFREPGYRLIARLRYRMFGRYAACPIPTAAERDRILGVYE